MDSVCLQRTKRVAAGHLWVFSNELATSPRAYEPGSLVEVRDKKGSFFGIGYINANSLIAVRILTREQEEITPDFFRRRIAGALEYRKRFTKDLHALRVVSSEGDFLPGLIVDKYGECVSVQFLTLGMERQKDIVLGVLDELLAPSTVVLRNDSRARLLEGLKLERTLVKGSLETLPVVNENGIRLEVDPYAGQKTGFFLDQRENRVRFGCMVGEGQHGLDLFCYTGAWGMHASAGGARITGVDTSEAAIRQAGRQAELNGVSGRCEFIKADVFAFLAHEVSAGNQYDFIVLDPPAFVKSRSTVREGLRGYAEINAQAMRLLRPGGLLATSSCSYHVNREAFLEMLGSAARDAGRQARLLEIRSQGHDHPVLLSMPETAYLTCAFLVVG